MSSISRSTAVGTLAACAVIGATSPVWADSGSHGTPDTGQTSTAAQDKAVVSALRAEIDKLVARLKAEDTALRDATHAAAKEARALESAKAEIAKLKAARSGADTAVPTTVVPAIDRHADPAAVPGFARHRCHHGDRADSGSWRGR